MRPQGNFLLAGRGAGGRGRLEHDTGGAEEHGYTFQRITPSGDEIPEDEKMSPAEIQADIENWQQQVLSAITQPGQKPYTPWTENNEKPYYTDKPDWDAFGAMLLVAACHVYGKPVPDTIENDWQFLDHPLIDQVRKRRCRLWE